MHVLSFVPDKTMSHLFLHLNSEREVRALNFDEESAVQLQRDSVGRYLNRGNVLLLSLPIGTSKCGIFRFRLHTCFKM